MSQRSPIALTIAGSDSSGGAGIQADLKTFTAFAVYGASVVTALTAQNTRGVHAVHAVPVSFVQAQLDAVLSDLMVGAIKTGMLATSAIVTAVSARLAAAPHIAVVVDPVMVATSGDALLDADAIGVVRTHLLPRATLVTPNIPEASRLLGWPQAATIDEQVLQAQALLAIGAKAVLLKGGHGEGDSATDVLAIGNRIIRLARPRIATTATHGTGCTLSAAIAALLATGVALEDAVARGKDFVWQAISGGGALGIGDGHGPIDHLYAIRKCAPPA